MPVSVPVLARTGTSLTDLVLQDAVHERMADSEPKDSMEARGFLEQSTRSHRILNWDNDDRAMNYEIV